MSKPRLYALSTCIHCKNTKKLLDSLGVDCETVDVDLLQGEEREEVVQEVKKYNPDLSFPTLVVDEDTVIVGYKEQQIQEALGK
ncbi:MAG: glutaredoxin family protein [Desulfonatronovibrionaceae bacterium]